MVPAPQPGSPAVKLKELLQISLLRRLTDMAMLFTAPESAPCLQFNASFPTECEKPARWAKSDSYTKEKKKKKRKPEA